MRRLLLLLPLLLACRVRGTPPGPEPQPLPEPPKMGVSWELSVGEGVSLPPALLPDGRAVAVTNSGKVVALDPDRGVSLLFNVEEPPTAGPVVVGDTVLVGTFYGHFYAYDTAGNLLFSDSSLSPIVGIAVGEGTVVVSEDGRIVMYGDTGRRWTRFAGDNVVVPPSVSGGAVFVATVSGNLLGYDRDGNPIMLLNLGGSLPTSPTPFDSLLILGTSDGRLQLVTLSGHRMSHPLPSPPTGEITAEGGRFFVSTLNGTLLYVEPDSVIWEVSLDTLPLASSPILTQRGIVVIDGSGTLYLLGYDGTVRDSLRVGGEWLEPLPYGSGLILVGRDGRVLGVNLDIRGLMRGWPLYRGSPERQGGPYGPDTAL